MNLATDETYLVTDTPAMLKMPIVKTPSMQRNNRTPLFPNSLK